MCCCLKRVLLPIIWDFLIEFIIGIRTGLADRLPVSFEVDEWCIHFTTPPLLWAKSVRGSW